MYVPSRRRCSLRVRTMTAFTTLPFCTCPSSADTFTAAVITSPSPAFNPVEPPSGRIICSLRAPELSATSTIVLLITAMATLPDHPLSFRRLAKRGGGLCFSSLRLQQPPPAPAPPCAQCLSTSSASASTADASPRVAPHRPHGPHSSRRARRTSCAALPRVRRTGAISCASPAPRSSSSCGSTRLLPPLPCGAPVPARWLGWMSWFPALAFLRCGRAHPLADDRLDARDVLAQPAHFLKALRLSHVQLELQLEQLVGEVALLVLQLCVSQVLDFFRF